jgi:hypothetical protein
MTVPLSSNPDKFGIGDRSAKGGDTEYMKYGFSHNKTEHSLLFRFPLLMVQVKTWHSTYISPPNVIKAVTYNMPTRVNGARKPQDISLQRGRDINYKFQ